MHKTTLPHITLQQAKIYMDLLDRLRRKQPNDQILDIRAALEMATVSPKRIHSVSDSYDSLMYWWWI